MKDTDCRLSRTRITGNRTTRLMMCSVIFTFAVILSLTVVVSRKQITIMGSNHANVNGNDDEIQNSNIQEEEIMSNVQIEEEEKINSIPKTILVMKDIMG